MYHAHSMMDLVTGTIPSHDVFYLSPKSVLLLDYLRDPISIYFADPVLANLPSGPRKSQQCTHIVLSNPTMRPMERGQRESIRFVQRSCRFGAPIWSGVGQRQGLPEPPIGNEEEMEPGLASSQKTRNNVIHQNLIVATPYSSRPHQYPASSDLFLEIAHSAPPQTALSTFSPHGSARLPHTFGSHLATRLFPQAKHWVHFVTRGSYYIEYQLMGEGGQMVPMYKVITDLLDRPIYGLRLNVELFSRFSL